MRDHLIPKRIHDDVIKGEISKADANDQLLSLIERTDNSKIRTESIDILGKIGAKSEVIFKKIENFLISDIDPHVRSASAKLIIENYLKLGLDPLKWALQHDKSPLVLKSIINLIGNPEIKHEILNWLDDFALKIGIVPDEAGFLLDVEVIFAGIMHEYEINSNTFEFYRFISDVKIGEPWFEVEDKHITSLTFNFFNWRYIKENLDVVGSISNLKYKDLFFITIRKYSPNSDFILDIPQSIGLLTSLKHLDLSRNNIKNLPESLSFLNSLKWLDLSRNTISSISTSLNDFFKSLDYYKV